MWAHGAGAGGAASYVGSSGRSSGTGTGAGAGAGASAEVPAAAAGVSITTCSAFKTSAACEDMVCKSKLMRRRWRGEREVRRGEASRAPESGQPLGPQPFWMEKVGGRSGTPDFSKTLWNFLPASSASLISAPARETRAAVPDGLRCALPLPRRLFRSLRLTANHWHRAGGGRQPAGLGRPQPDQARTQRQPAAKRAAAVRPAADLVVRLRGHAARRAGQLRRVRLH